MSADGPGGTALEARGLDVLYGDYQILWDVSFSARRGEVVAILGPNGSGKSTLMNTLSGLVRARAGEIRLGDRRIDSLPPHKIVGLGLAHVLERRRLFPYLTVRQNLLLGAYHPEARARCDDTLAEVEALFPHLRERHRQIAEVLTAINRERGITVVFIEQNVGLALRMAHRGYVLESGRAILEGTSADLLASSEVKRIFLGH